MMQAAIHREEGPSLITGRTMLAVCDLDLGGRPPLIDRMIP